MKNSFFALPPNEQRNALSQAAIFQKLPKQAVEKDLWVTAIIQICFSLPCADSLVFKGGTSLSKAWELISRFSEDIDLAIDRKVFEYEGDLTKRQIKKLRKASSLFVRDELYAQLVKAVEESPLGGQCQIKPQPDGVGDDTYPEPRRILINYQSRFEEEQGYLSPTVVIEAGARSLLEPNKEVKIGSLLESAFPQLDTTLADVMVKTSLAEKTFLEKAFLLYELFSTPNGKDALRRSRHIYDLYMMMQKGVHERAIKDDVLWESIRHHRSVLTSVGGVDYSPDVRDRICLVPPDDCIGSWQKDYDEMSGAMIYGERPAFEQMIEGMRMLEQLFRERSK